MLRTYRTWMIFISATLTEYIKKMNKKRKMQKECKKECKKMQEKCQLLEKSNINRYERYFYQLAELIYNSYASISYFA